MGLLTICYPKKESFILDFDSVIFQVVTKHTPRETRRTMTHTDVLLLVNSPGSRALSLNVTVFVVVRCYQSRDTPLFIVGFYGRMNPHQTNAEAGEL